MAMTLDVKARCLLDQPRPRQAVLVTLLSNYGLPGQVVSAEWYPLERAVRDPDLARLDVPAGVPIFAHRRLADYVRWQPLALTARGPAWWPALAVERAGEVVRHLSFWKQSHPGLRSPERSHMPAA